MLVTALIHPIDTERHPTVPAGWRWAVIAGDTGSEHDPQRVANAGWCPDARTAELEGDQNAATAVRTCQILGLPVRYGGVRRLDHDPVPAGDDQIHLG